MGIKLKLPVCIADGSEMTSPLEKICKLIRGIIGCDTFKNLDRSIAHNTSLILDVVASQNRILG